MPEHTQEPVIEQANGARIKVPEAPVAPDPLWEDDTPEAEQSFWSLTGLGAVKTDPAETSGSMRRLVMDEVSAQHRVERARMFTTVGVTSVLVSLVFNGLILAMGSEFSLAAVLVGVILGYAVYLSGPIRGRELRQWTAVLSTYAVIASTWTMWFYDMTVNPHLYERDLSGDFFQQMTGSIWGWQGSAELGVAMAYKTVPFSLATFNMEAAALAVGQTVIFPIVLFQQHILQGIVVLLVSMVFAWRISTIKRKV